MPRWTNLATLAGIVGLVWAAFFLAGSAALLYAVTRATAPRPAAAQAAPSLHESQAESLGPVAMPASPPERIEPVSPVLLGEADEAESAPLALPLIPELT